MKKNAMNPDELDLFQIAEAGRKLEERRKALEESKRRDEEERSDLENTLPPSDVVGGRHRQNEHQNVVSRSEVREVRRKLGKALLMLALLIATSAILIWWGLELMRGS